MDANETVLLDQRDVWITTTAEDETSEEFADRVVRTVTHRLDRVEALAKAVDALID
jgi:hypothetical protein